jgi:triosephosphate isomerase (TIM)
MTSGDDRRLLAANWKMNPVTRVDAVELARGVTPAALDQADLVQVVLFPPFPWLAPVAAALDGTGLELGGQDCHWERSGAFTGEVSAAMLHGLGGWVIVGHSERRGQFGETDEQVGRKAAAALAAGLRVVICVGEREDQHDAGRTEQVVRDQLQAALGPLDAAAADRLVVAYEPVWAIGSGRNADPAYAGATMDVVRRGLDEAFGPAQSARVRVLYGGSANAANVASYVELESCAGCLVGGASLRVEEFSRMIEAVAQVAGSRAR